MGAYINSVDTQFNKSWVSCGVVEMHHLPTKSPRQTLFQLANNLYHKANPRPAAFAIFSDVVEKEGRGIRLAEFIQKQVSIGELTSSDIAVNPKTGNSIILWTLTINHEKFRAWYAEELMHRVEENS